MKIADVRKLLHSSRLWYWVTERERIRLKKEAGEPHPLTDDEILQRYRFCNVRRMDDAVSRWLLEHWYTPHRDHPHSLHACVLARHFNVPECLAEITRQVFEGGGRGPDWKEIKKKVRARKADGRVVFNGAYMIRGIGTADKTEMVVDEVCRPLHDDPPAIDPGSMEASVGVLLPRWGFGTFMAGQVVADLRHAVTGTWADARRWAPPGPGSLRGIARYYGRATDPPTMAKTNWGPWFEQYRLECEDHLPAEVCRRMEAIDWQNCLCEFDKYERALWGRGKPKQLYRGGEVCSSTYGGRTAQARAPWCARC